MTIAFLFLTFTLVLFFGVLLLPILESSALGYYLYMGFCAIFAVGLTYLYFSDKLSKILRNIYVLGVGTLIGAFMGIAMPLWTTIVLLVGVSVWDYISVKRGPIKGIMEIMGHVDPDEVRNLTKEDLDQAEIQIGIGDVAFYSMLTSGCLISSGRELISGLQLTILGSILTTVLASIGILIGTFITLRALRKNTILPGLPLSIFLGLFLAVLTYIVLVNIDFFKLVLP
jgi:presenilin-like A22 family membrane protease